ncbi:MAG: hypothetical protein ABI777_00450 [Betaproteobacteria bacterium]
MKIQVLAIGMGLAAGSFAATAQQADAMLAPLLSKDPAQPFVLQADRIWSADEIAIQPRAVTGTPKDLPRSSRELKIASFMHKGERGPVTLAIDYTAYLIDPSSAGEGTLNIGIECPETPNGCSYPISKSVLLFQSAFMARQEVPASTGKRTIVVGRESHAYTLPSNALVDVRVALLESMNLEPLQVKARLIYGDYDRRALPGQATRIETLWYLIGGAIVLLLTAFWWLRRT